MEVQTRNLNGQRQSFNTIKQAFDYVEKEVSVWKISWTNESTNEPIRLVRMNPGSNLWIYEPVDEIEKLGIVVE